MADSLFKHRGQEKLFKIERAIYDGASLAGEGEYPPFQEALVALNKIRDLLMATQHLWEIMYVDEDETVVVNSASDTAVAVYEQFDTKFREFIHTK